MGRRADKAYEDACREDLRRWRVSLTWQEYQAWQWERWRYFLLGAMPVATGFLIAEFLL